MRQLRSITICGMLLLLALGSTCARAETGADAWLRYAPLEKQAAQKYSRLPASVVVLGDSPVLESAKAELIRGIRGMLGKTLRDDKTLPSESAIVLGTISALQSAAPEISGSSGLHEDGFLLAAKQVH